MSPQAVMVRDAEDRIVFWNKGAEELYGHRAEEALGRVSGELLRTELQPCAGRVTEALHAHGRWSGTLIRFDRSGRRIAARADWTRSPGGPEDDGLILETNSRIPEQETAPTGPVEETTLEALVAALPVGVVVMSASGALVSMNDTARRHPGISSPEEMLPQLRRHIEHFRAGSDGAPVLPLQRGGALLAAPGEPAEGGEGLGRHPLSNGTESPLACTVIPVHPASGQEPLFVLALQDVTERRRSEEALRHANQKLRENQRRLDALLTNASVAIFMMDDRYHCVYMNPAAKKLSGYTLEEMEGRTLHDVVHHTRPDGSPFPIEECPIGLSLPGNDQAQGEEVFVHKDGSFYPVAFSAAPIRDESSSIIGTILEVRDIRQEKRTLEALREADRAKDEFLAMLGHELRNPLSPIVTCLHLMRLRGMQSRELEIIGRQAEHLTRLVDDLLDVSRVSRGLVELRTSRLEMGEIVARSIEIARPLLEQGAHRLVLDVPASGLLVEADGARMSQVVSNLLVNAAKFSPRQSTVMLSAWKEAGTVVVSVKDEGQGIAPEMLARIFEPFVQGTPGQQRSRKGLGLGLAIARNLVQLHRGTLQARSDGPGRGAEFVLTLPQTAPGGQVALVEDREPRRLANRSKRVLVVDDNPDVAETLKRFLEDVGHSVLAVSDAATALEKVKVFAPEVAILDIDLPVMNGYELATKLREIFRGGDTLRLIALTGYGLQRDREHSASAGFDVHLVKPVDGNKLMDAIG